jgi:hypothetical protein
VVSHEVCCRVSLVFGRSIQRRLGE